MAFNRRCEGILDRLLANKPELDHPSSHNRIVESAQRNLHELTRLTIQANTAPVGSAVGLRKVRYFKKLKQPRYLYFMLPVLALFACIPLSWRSEFSILTFLYLVVVSVSAVIWSEISRGCSAVSELSSDAVLQRSILFGSTFIKADFDTQFLVGLSLFSISIIVIWSRRKYRRKLFSTTILLALS
jgi:hypothetical protein